MSAKKIFKEVAETIEAIGEESTVRLLIDGRKNTVVDKDLDFVLNMVCAEFKYSIEDVINDKSPNKKKNLAIAIKMIAYYGSLLELTNRKIGSAIKRHQGMVTDYRKEILDALGNKSNKSDVTTIQKYCKVFDAKIEDYKKLKTKKQKLKTK